MNVLSSTLPAMSSYAQSAHSWVSSLTSYVGTQTSAMVQAGANALAQTHRVRMDVGQDRFIKNSQTHMMTTGHVADAPVYETEPVDVAITPDSMPPKSGEALEPIHLYKIYHKTFGLLLRTGAHWIATPFMYSGRKDLMFSVFLGGNQPEAFDTIMGNPFANEPIPADLTAPRLEGATNTGLAYVWWIASNVASIFVAKQLLAKAEEMYAAGTISRVEYKAQKKIMTSCLNSNKLMLVDTALFVSSFLYMGTPGHSEEVGLGLLLLTQLGNMVAHGSMFHRNKLMLDYNKEKANLGDSDTTLNSIFRIQKYSLAAFLCSSGFLIGKAAVCADSVEVANDILMNATHYPLVFLTFLIGLRGYGAVTSLRDAVIDYRKASELNTSSKWEKISLDVGNDSDEADHISANITKARGRMTTSAANVAAAAFMLGGIAMSHPVVSYNAPWLKVMGTTILFGAALPSLWPMFKLTTWKDGFWAGLENFKHKLKNGK
jgi:hypothetical protein